MSGMTSKASNPGAFHQDISRTNAALNCQQTRPHSRYLMFSSTINQLLEDVLDDQPIFPSCISVQFSMTHHEKDTAFHVLTSKSVNQAIEPVSPRIRAETEIDATRNEEKDEGALEHPGVEFELSHAPSLVEDESFYVSLFCGLSF